MVGVKALLTLVGIRAIPPLVESNNKAIHDLVNFSQMLSGGHRRMARLSAEAAEAMTNGDTEGRDRALREQSGLRVALNDLVKRLD